MVTIERQDEAVLDEMIALALALADELHLSLVGAHLSMALEALRAVPLQLGSPLA